MSSLKYNRAYIESLINTQAEESTYLEFKSAGALKKEGNYKDEITKDISAFANADGGVLIYGLKEREHKADSIDFIDGNISTKEWLQQMIDGIKRKIPGLEIIPIRFDKEITKTIYIVNISRSNEGAHQATDGRFYKRRNFKNDIMEEYEIRDSYNRAQKTELEILEPKITGNGDNNMNVWLNEYTVNIELYIRNTSKIVETIYKLEIKLPNQLSLGQFQKEFGSCLNRNEGIYSVFLISQKAELYPDEEISISKFYAKFREPNFQQVTTNPIRVKLYYSSGVKEKEIFILPFLKHSGRDGNEHQLAANCFNNRGCK